MMKTRPISPLREGAFRTLLAALTADLIGDQIWLIALAWVAAISTDATTASLVVACGAVPRLLLMLPAGALVDKLGPMKVAQVGQIIRIATMASAASIGMIHPPSTSLLVVLALMFGLGDAARLPSIGAIPPLIVEKEDLTRAQGFVGLSSRFSSVIAAPIAGILLENGGIRSVGAVNTILFCFALILLFQLRRKMHSRQEVKKTSKRSIRAGLSYLRGNRPVFYVLIGLTILNMAIAGPLGIGLVMYVRGNSWGSPVLSLLVVSFSLSAALGALMVARTRRPRSPASAGFAWVAVAMTGIVALPFLSEAPSAAVAMAVTGFAMGPATALLVGFVQSETDASYVGRIMSMISLSSHGTTPISMAGFGFLIGWVGVTYAFSFTGMVIIVLATASLLSPILRLR